MNEPSPIALSPSLGHDEDRAPIFSESDLERFARAIPSSFPERIGTAINQAKYGLSRILSSLRMLTAHDATVLEIGAGCMLLSAYLASKGLRVTALEPLTPDFSWFGPIQAEILDYCARHEIAFERVDSFAEDFVAPDRFDFIFTIHVLEHVRDPWCALDNMYHSLRRPGRLLAVCPNYDVPFEPHLGILLVGRSKGLNARLYPAAIRRQKDLWDGLYFVRYSRISRYLARRNIAFSFSRTMLRDAFVRLGEDRLFWGRMPWPIRWAYRVLAGLRLIQILPLVPLRLQTPMELVIQK